MSEELHSNNFLIEDDYSVIDGNDFGFVHVWGESDEMPVILLHGFMQSGKSWAAVARTLSAEYCVYAPDLFGFGRSQLSGEQLKNPAVFTLDFYCDQLDCLIDYISPDRPVALVGYSMGGRIAATYAVKHPEKVATLVLESCGLGPRTPEEKQERIQKDNRMLERLTESGDSQLDSHLMERFVDFWEGLALFESQKSLDEAVRKNVRAERLANDPQVLARVISSAGAHTMEDLRLALARQNRTILYLAGEFDVAYTEVATSFKEVWLKQNPLETPFDTPKLEVIVVPLSGHNIHLEHMSDYSITVGIYLARTYR